MPFCKHCGSEIPSGAKFCRNCGQAVVLPSQPISTEPPTPQPEPVVVPPVPQPEPVVVPPTPQPEPAVIPPVPEPEPVVASPAPQPEPVAVPPTPQPEPVVVPPTPQPEPAVVPPTPQSEPAEVPPTPQPEPVVIPPIVTHPEQEFRSPFEGDKPKTNRLPLIIVLSILILCGVGAALWLFVFDKKNDEVELTYTPKTEQMDAGKGSSAQKEEVKEISKTDAVAENEPVAESSTSSLSTLDTPKESDFQGWFINGASKSGMPKNVKTLNDLGSISGSWKALFYQDPNNKYDVKAYGFANVNVSGTKDNLKFGIKRHTTRFLSSGEVINEEGESEDIFMGKWQNGKITASGAGSLSITSFWEQNGKQYAIGTFDSPDGIPVKIGMVRP